MNAEPEKLSCLPDSFDLSKYASCKQFGVDDWYNNLMHRALRRRFNVDGVNYHFGELKGVADRFLRQPIIPHRNLKEGDGFRKNVFRSQVRDQTAFQLVSGHWVLELYTEHMVKYQQAFSTMRRAMFDGSSDDEHASKKAFEDLDVPAWKMMADIGYPSDGEVSITVDLYASEEKLLEDFRSWLRKTRKNLGVPNLQSRFSSADFERWCQYQILAYLDLTFWAEVHGKRLTHQMLGVSLFPNEYNVSLAERIRKVVAPMAQAASSTPYLEALLSQALADKEQG